MTEYLVRASALQGIRATVEELGGDADALLRSAGLLEMEKHPQSWFAYRSYLHTVDNSNRLLLRRAGESNGFAADFVGAGGCSGGNPNSSSN